MHTADGQAVLQTDQAPGLATGAVPIQGAAAHQIVMI